MARKRSRISDTPIVQDSHSTRQSATASATASAGEADREKTLEAASTSTNTGSARETNQQEQHDDSNTAAGPLTRSTEAFCKKCGADVGEFYNSFHQVTNTYYLPALLGSYHSKLLVHGKQKAASLGTVLNGCQILPLICPGCGDTLAFNVVKAPAATHAFRGRDFFKLTKIVLKCEHKGFLTTVAPQVDVAPDPVSQVEDESIDSEKMEIEAARPPPTHAPHGQPPPPPQSSSDRQRVVNQQNHHQSLPPIDSSRQNISTQPVASPKQPPHLYSHPQKSPSNHQPSPIQQSISGINSPRAFAPPPPAPGGKDANVGLANRTRDLPAPVISNSPAHESHQPNGQYYPRSPQEVQIDAIQRLQIQVSQNAGALMVHGKDLRSHTESLAQQANDLRREFQSQIQFQQGELRRVDDAIGRLQREMMGVREMLEIVSKDLSAHRETNARIGGHSVPPSATVSAQDSALELMANNLANVAQKANEVDTLKVTIEIMRNRIQRLEENAANVVTATTAPSATSHPFPSPREPSAHSTHSSHTIPSYHTTTNSVPHINTPIHPTQRPQQPSFHHVSTPEIVHRPDPAPSQSGWVTVNANAKRAHPNGIEGPHDVIGQPVGSPKRPKLAPIEPRMAYNPQAHPPHQQQVVYERMDTDEGESRPPSLPQVQTQHQPQSQSQSQSQYQPTSQSLSQSLPHSIPPSQTQSRESLPESTAASTNFIAYSTQDLPPEDSWRPESQRVEHRSPRGGRGRGGGPGSRGGRPRKSLPTDTELGTPEWEKEDWQGVTESQMSPNGYYNPMSGGRSGRGIVRRGSGGGGIASRTQRPTSSGGRAVSLGLQGVTTGPGIGMAGDPYAHTKKTRTKPIRNADGILIRKDGRPDMRSQSSAANLRKVHARKEEQKAHDRSFTPTPGLSTHHGSMSADTPSPTAGAAEGAGPNTVRKHQMIMNKIFPHGIDESRGRHDYARHIFEAGGVGPSVSSHSASSPLEMKIKREHHDYTRVGEIDSPHDGDVDMDPEHDEHDMGETPSGHSEGSDQMHSAFESHEMHDAEDSTPAQVADSQPEVSENGPRTEGEASAAPTTQTVGA